MRELNEMLIQSQMVGKLYGKIYNYTEYGDEVLDLMDEFLEEDDVLDLFNGWLNNGDFKLRTYVYDDTQQLIETLDNVLVELRYKYNH